MNLNDQPKNLNLRNPAIPLPKRAIEIKLKEN